jgi:hypothetical protein
VEVLVDAGRVGRVFSQSNQMILHEDPGFNCYYCFAISLIANVGSQVGLAGAVTVESLPWYTFAMVTDVYVFNGRVVSPVWTLESCDLETVSTREG